MVSHRDQSQVHCFVPVQFYSPEPTTDIITLTSYPDVLKFEVEKLWQYKVYSCGGMQRDDVTPAARHKNVFVVVCNVKPNDALHGKANKGFEQREVMNELKAPTWAEAQTGRRDFVQTQSGASPAGWSTR